MTGKMLRNIMSSIQNLIKFSSVTNPGTDDKSFPQSQLSSYGQSYDSYMIWPYGMGGVAPEGAYCVTFSTNGHEEVPVTIASTPTLRPKNLKAGEVYVGNLISGATITFDEKGAINIVAPGGVNIVGDITINGDAIITGDLSVNGDTVLDGTVNLGGSGGPGIARIGDTVSGGIITSGSLNSFST